MGAALAGWLLPRSQAVRVANLELQTAGLPDTYLMFSKDEPGRGHVVNRRDSTLRRDDRKQPGRKWHVTRIEGESGDPTWLVQSKRIGKGTVFFVPLMDVPDWAYPYLYEFVRELDPDLELPPATWTQLYVNRLYRGLYLRVALPFDRRKKDGGSGVLRDILSVRGDRLMQVDTRFDDTPGVYVDTVVDGYLPALQPPDPALAWLARRCPVEGTTLLLSNVEPHALSLLPLPISLPDLFEARGGRPPATFVDARYARWTEAGWRAQGNPFTPEQRARLEEGFEAWAASFRSALRADARLHARLERTRSELPERQASLADLGLSLVEP